MSNGDKTKSQLVAADNQLTNLKEREQDKAEAQKTVFGFAGARIGTRLITTLVPSIGGLMPVAEILGGGYLIMKGMDPRTKDNGLKLGLGLGLSVGVVDRVGDFIVTAAAKFKGGIK